MSDRYLMTLTAAGLVAAGLCSLCGCGREASVATAAGVETVCIDVKTGDVVLVPGRPRFPAVNPASGAATLMPGLYCPQCQAWHRAPPIEELHRQKGVARCPKCKGPLVADGPRPTTSTTTP